MTEVNITPDAPQETQAEIDALVAKAEGKPATPPQEENTETPERPEWLPEKFSSPEDMAKAYAALEQKMGKPNAEPEGTGEGEGEGEGTQEEVEQAVNDVVAAAGLSVQDLTSKVMANGDLDEADYEALAKQGITKEMAQSYVAGQKALASNLVNEMHASVGGQEQFDNILSWAKDNLSTAEIEAFNNTVDTGSEAAVKLALNGLNARFKAEGGEAPKLVGGKRGGNTPTDVFRSTSELTKAMSDPRYTKDPAYRADVMAKLERSSIL